MPAAIDNAYDAIHKGIAHASAYVADNKAAAAVAGSVAVISLYGLGRLVSAKKHYKSKPTALELSGGNIAKSQVNSFFEDYAASYTKSGATDQKVLKDKTRTQELVSTFYNLVTDLYEWGWGTSFHFSPLLPGKTVAASEAAHEARIGALLNLTPGKKALDAGCGVGGPMRTIAACTGAQVVGVTINDYQVERSEYHNEKLGLAALCTTVQGDYLQLPFQPETFDGAFSIESTCHAPKLEQVYKEIYRVLKPGARYVSYEWVTTKLFDPNNEEHVKIVDEINWGNGLPDMRTYKQAEEAGVAAGFKLVMAQDLATASTVAAPWYNRLHMNRFIFRTINGAIVNTLCFLGLAPKGFNKVHDMLLDTVDALLQGGQQGIFTPMYMLVFEKPADAETA